MFILLITSPEFDTCRLILSDEYMGIIGNGARKLERLEPHLIFKRSAASEIDDGT
jgi:hypothetical protein